MSFVCDYIRCMPCWEMEGMAILQLKNKRLEGKVSRIHRHKERGNVRDICQILVTITKTVQCLVARHVGQKPGREIKMVLSKVFSILQVCKTAKQNTFKRNASGWTLKKKATQSSCNTDAVGYTRLSLPSFYFI